MRTVLGIDLGTQSLKVVVYDFESRHIAATAASPLDLDQDASGKAEQDPEGWLDALGDSLAKISPDIRDSIRAIGVSGQQHGLVAGKVDPSIRMPHGKQALSEEEILKIEYWIEQGAKNN